MPWPAPGPPGLTETRYDYQPDGSARRYPPDTYPRGTAPRTMTGGDRKPAAKRSAAARAVISAVIVLVLAAVGVAAWSFSRSPNHSSAAPSPTRPRSSPAGPGR